GAVPLDGAVRAAAGLAGSGAAVKGVGVVLHGLGLRAHSAEFRSVEPHSQVAGRACLLTAAAHAAQSLDQKRVRSQRLRAVDQAGEELKVARAEEHTSELQSR